MNWLLTLRLIGGKIKMIIAETLCLSSDRCLSLVIFFISTSFIKEDTIVWLYICFADISFISVLCYVAMQFEQKHSVQTQWRNVADGVFPCIVKTTDLILINRLYQFFYKFFKDSNQFTDTVMSNLSSKKANHTYVQLSIHSV